MAKSKRRTRQHPLTVREQACLVELRAWGEHKIDLQAELDSHWQAFPDIVRRSLETGIHLQEIADQALIHRTTLTRRLIWRPKDDRNTAG